MTSLDRFYESIMLVWSQRTDYTLQVCNSAINRLPRPILVLQHHYYWTCSDSPSRRWPLGRLGQRPEFMLVKLNGEWVGEKWKQNTTASGLRQAHIPDQMPRCINRWVSSRWLRGCKACRHRQMANASMFVSESTRPPEWEFISRISSGFCWFQGTQKPGNQETCSSAGTELLPDPHVP